MLDTIFPRSVDAGYRGRRLGLWIFGLVIFMKTGIALSTIFNGRHAAISADGIPVDTYTPAGERAFLTQLAAWGLSQVALNLIGWVVLIRYRALVPFMFTLLLLEHVIRRLVYVLMPIERIGTPRGLYINLAMIAVMVLGLVLSVRTWRRAQSNTPPAPDASTDRRT